jgi:hypothetical protein
MMTVPLGITLTGKNRLKQLQNPLTKNLKILNKFDWPAQLSVSAADSKYPNSLQFNEISIEKDASTILVGISRLQK